MWMVRLHRQPANKLKWALVTPTSPHIDLFPPCYKICAKTALVYENLPSIRLKQTMSDALNDINTLSGTRATMSAMR